MGYKIRRSGHHGYKSYLHESGLDIADRDLPEDHPDNEDRRRLTNDDDWGGPRLTHVFEDENEAHAWARKNNGHEGQLSVVDAETGERIEDPRGSGTRLEGFDSAVKRYIDTTGDSYPGQSDWRRG